MRLILLLAACFAPALMWAVYAARKKIRWFLLVGYFAAALAAVIAAVFLQWLYMEYIPLPDSVTAAVISKSFIISALIEEAVKMSVIVFLLRVLIHSRKPDTANQAVQDDTVWLSLIAIFFGLSFGGFETVSYSLRYPDVLPLRIITAVFLHGSLVAFFVPVAEGNGRLSIFPFLRAVVLHGLYNMFFLLGGWFVIPGCAVLARAVLYAFGRLNPAGDSEE